MCLNDKGLSSPESPAFLPGVTVHKQYYRKEVLTMSDQLEQEVTIGKLEEEETLEYRPPMLQSVEEVEPVADIICITKH